MAFTFEALPARYGDSLFLTFKGRDRRTQRVLIDGGPSRVYEKFVRPRLQKEAQALGEDELVLDAIMISHIDEDHIKGVLDLMSELRDADDGQMRRPWNVRWLLHNSFDALLDESEGAAARALGGVTVLAALGGEDGLRELLGHGADHATELVLASYKQGSQLASLSAALNIARNPPDGSTIMSVKTPRVLRFGEATFTIVGPRESEIEKLRKEWRAWRATQKDKPKPPTVALAEAMDTSVPNLSSIVALIRHGKGSALITGDARSDYILDGLEAAGQLKHGKLHVDILKMPHHGSFRNVEGDFLKHVTADHYVASGDGTYGNPDRETLELIAEVRRTVLPNRPYTIHITYDGDSCDKVHEDWARGRKGQEFGPAKAIGPRIREWTQDGPVRVNNGGRILIQL